MPSTRPALVDERGAARAVVDVGGEAVDETLVASAGGGVVDDERAGPRDVARPERPPGPRTTPVAGAASDSWAGVPPAAGASSRARSVRTSRATSVAGSPSTVRAAQVVLDGVGGGGDEIVGDDDAAAQGPVGGGAGLGGDLHHGGAVSGGVLARAGRRRRHDADQRDGGDAAWAPRSRAMHSVTLRAVGRWRNSFGPWALLPGTERSGDDELRRPGTRSPSIPMKGIEPPSPKYPAGAPNAAVDASSSAVVQPRRERRRVPARGRVGVGEADRGVARAGRR